MIFFASILFLVHVYAAPQEQGADIFDAEDTCLAKYPSLTRGELKIINYDSLIIRFN